MAAETDCERTSVATRTELSERWHDLIDFDAGGIAAGESTIENAGPPHP